MNNTLKIILTAVFLSITFYCSAQVRVTFNNMYPSFDREDIFNLNVSNSTGVEIVATIQVEVYDDTGKLMYGFLAPDFHLDPGWNMLRPEHYENIRLYPDQFSLGNETDTFRMTCNLLHPLDLRSIIARTEISFAEDNFDFEKSSPVFPNSSTPVASSETPYGYVMPTKMNVFYIGLDNPVEISNMTDSTYLSIGEGPASCTKLGNNRFNITASRPGIVIAEIWDGNQLRNKVQFRVKRIPNPVPQLGNKRGGSIGYGEFKAQGGVLAILENFDFDARCIISGFELIRVSPQGERSRSINQGARFTEDSRVIINEAIAGDVFIFNRIKARCPGDAAGRNVGTMSFLIQ